MHIYSAATFLSSATFFLDFDAFAATFRFFENPEILAAHLDLPQLFFFQVSQSWLIISGQLPWTLRSWLNLTRGPTRGGDQKILTGKKWP
jgi:hypothetical protein